MFDDCTAITKMNVDKGKEDYAICNNELDQKYFIAWSPLEENKFSLKHRYVSCSRSVPHKNKRLVRYRISRSLNFDTSVCNSSSESSSFEEDKHLSRSAKIMRALNFNNSPSYYGKTKIKKSLNFNLTPSPKRFRHIKKDIRKSLSANFNPPLSLSNKFSSFDDNPSDSANSSLLFSSSDSIDENQNETPSQQNSKEHDMMHYSTPNAKLSKKSLCSSNFTPLLRSRLRETIDNIVYVTATPNSQSLKHIKGSSKYASNVAVNTSRNLLHEFHDEDDSRPCTPQNVICLIPESMSAIKRSHKKERSSKRNEHCATQFPNNFVNDESILQDRARPLLTRHKKYADTLEDFKSDIDRCSNKNFNSNDLASSHSEDDMSDTGSLFDYTEEREHILKVSKVSDWSSSNSKVEPKLHEFDVKMKPEGNIIECVSEFKISSEHELLQDRGNVNANILSDRNIDLTVKSRSITPEPGKEVILDSEKSITPENRINILQTIAKDSIKKSHKKTKDDNKRRLFSPKVLQGKLNATEGQESIKISKNFEQRENITDESKMFIEQDYLDDASMGERSPTPENVNSSRLLLSQFSSIKKSHKKDKHNKILSGFLKRQEYFNKNMDVIPSSKYKTFNMDGISKCKNDMQDSSSDFDGSANTGDPISSATSENLNTSLDKLSPSKRKEKQDVSVDSERSISCDSELQELDTSKEEFKIFTPLKRKKSLIASAAVEEYSHFYGLPYEKSVHSEDIVTNISFSRCLTPVPNFPNSCGKMRNDDIAIESNDNINNEDIEEDCDFDNVTGRLTPRNMSTTELYPNLDSIKKSHKKNKREHSSRKIRSNDHVDEKHEISMENTANEIYNPLEFSNECITVDDIMNKSIYDKLISNDDIEGPTNFTIDDQNCASTSAENISTTTPPNCLKMKNYIKVLQETSIKRSHKKVRDKRKQESAIDANELSDDGSIFGNEEKLVSTGDKCTHD